MITAQIMNYLNTHYLTLEQLGEKTAIKAQKILTLVENHCVPTYSHRVISQKTFETCIFGSTHFTEEEIHYYHPSLIEWIKKAEYYSQTLSFSKIAQKMKADFREEVKEAFVEVEGARERFEFCFDNAHHLKESGICQWMSAQWPYIMNGTSGVCLKEISARNIIIKAIAVSVLEKYANCETPFTQAQQKEIVNAAQRYDQVASLFGLHELEKSTRGRLFNKCMEKIRKNK